MCRVRLIQAKSVKARGHYNDSLFGITIENLFSIPIALTLWVITGMIAGSSFSFKRGDVHIHAKFSINNKVYSIRTSHKAFYILDRKGFFKSDKFKKILLDDSYH